MATRDHDKAIRALRDKARDSTKITDGEWMSGSPDLPHVIALFRHQAAAYSLAAEYLASITGKEERAAKRAKKAKAATRPSGRRIWEDLPR